MAKAVNKQSFNPRVFMEMAIEEMKKSKNEPRPDGKVPPKVGAILVLKLIGDNGEPTNSPIFRENHLP